MENISVSGTAQLEVEGDNGLNYTPLCSYASSDATKASVSASGLVTGVAAGSATITVTYLPSGEVEAITDTIDFTVSA